MSVYRHFLLPFLAAVCCGVAAFVTAVATQWWTAGAFAAAAAGWFVVAVMLAEDPDQRDTP